MSFCLKFPIVFEVLFDLIHHLMKPLDLPHSWLFITGVDGPCADHRGTVLPTAAAAIEQSHEDTGPTLEGEGKGKKAKLFGIL